MTSCPNDFDLRQPVQLWLTTDGTRSYIVPYGTVLQPGDLHLVGPGEATIDVAPRSVHRHAVDREEARAYLRERWDQAVGELRDAWMGLVWFGARTGDQLRIEDLVAPIQQGIALAGEDAEEAFATAIAVVESISRGPEISVEGPGFDEAAALRATFGRLPELLEQFTDPALDAAATNPDAWAERLSAQVFGEGHAGMSERRRRELADEVGLSIARRLREAGLTPSTDDEPSDPATRGTSSDPTAYPRSRPRSGGRGPSR